MNGGRLRRTCGWVWVGVDLTEDAGGVWKAVDVRRKSSRAGENERTRGREREENDNATDRSFVRQFDRSIERWDGGLKRGVEAGCRRKAMGARHQPIDRAHLLRRWVPTRGNLRRGPARRS